MQDDFEYNYEALDDQYEIDDLNVSSIINDEKYSNCLILSEHIIQQLYTMKDKLYLDYDNETIDNCMNLMVKYKWSEELLNQSQFFDNDEIKVQLYQNGTLFLYKIQTELEECISCQKLDESYSMGCYHYYCLECHSAYILDELKKNESPSIKCRDKYCQTLIPFSFIKYLSIDVICLFKKILCKSYLENKNRYTPCITEKCNNICEKDEFIFCSKCLQNFCIKCKQESHFPLECDRAKLWVEKVPLFEFFSNQKAQYQFCINCNEPSVIKDKEDLIQCKCGNLFCSRCGFDHEIKQSSRCLFKNLSIFQKLYHVHITVLYQFKTKYDEFKQLALKITLIKEKQDQLEQEHITMHHPSLSFSFKSILQSQSLVQYMILQFEYYHKEKFDNLMKKINMKYYQKLINDQMSNYEDYLLQFSNLQNQDINYDEFLHTFESIRQIDQQLIIETNQLISEIKKNM